MKKFKCFSCLIIAILILSVFFGCSSERRYSKDNYRSTYSHKEYDTDFDEKDDSDNAPKTEPPTDDEPEVTEPYDEYDGKYDIYEVGNVEIGIPKEYSSEIVVVTDKSHKSEYTGILKVYEKKSKEESEKYTDYTAGLLFEIGYTTDETDFIKNKPLPSSTIFAKDGSRYYVYTTPMDYQLYRHNGVDSADEKEWENLRELGSKVKNIFKEINDISSYETDYSKYENDNNNNNYDDDNYNDGSDKCGFCKGSGFCTHCIGGGCTNSRCYGGKIRCSSCLGSRDCGKCGGFGYVYKGVGLSHRKQQCSSCRGLGDCSSCHGAGESLCSSCGGSGNCNYCSGTGNCKYCYGSGKQY